MNEPSDHAALVATMTGGMVSEAPNFSGSDRLHSDGRPKGMFRDELRKVPNLLNAWTVLSSLAAPDHHGRGRRRRRLNLDVQSAGGLPRYRRARPSRARARERLERLHHRALRELAREKVGRVHIEVDLEPIARRDRDGAADRGVRIVH